MRASRTDGARHGFAEPGTTVQEGARLPLRSKGAWLRKDPPPEIVFYGARHGFADPGTGAWLPLRSKGAWLRQYRFRGVRASRTDGARHGFAEPGTMSTTPRSGGQVLVDQLLVHGADMAFAVPGESYLPVLDALHDVAGRLRLIVCRHEAGAANAAEAWGKLTGRPGVCLVTRGPGATQAAVGVHTAMQDSTPLLLLVGQVERGHRGREAFQEIDIARVFGGLAKWAVEIDDAARIPELVSRAYHVATSGRPGPVVLGLPEDMLGDEVEVADAAPYHAVQTGPSDAELAEVRSALAAATRPIVLIGGSPWDQEAADDLRAFAEANALPVAAGFRRQAHLSHDSPSYVGECGLGINPDLRALVAGADLVLAIGTRLGDVTTGGYERLAPPRPAQKLIHVHPSPDELGRVYSPDLAIVSSGPRFVRAARALAPIDAPPWREPAASARSAYERWCEPEPRETNGVDLGAVMAHLRDALPEDAVVCNGAGNYTVWMHRYGRFRRYGTQLAPTSGAMGYGLPAAIAAKALHPERVVVAFAGDGCFQMQSCELATAVQEGLAIVVLIANNGMYGTIRMHQERLYPGRVVGTGLDSPDFTAFAHAHGAHGEMVERNGEFPAALARALAGGRARRDRPAHRSARDQPDRDPRGCNSRSDRAR